MKTIGEAGISDIQLLGIHQMNLDDYFQLVEAHILLKNHYMRKDVLCKSEEEASYTANIMLTMALNGYEPMPTFELIKGSIEVKHLVERGIPDNV